MHRFPKINVIFPEVCAVFIFMLVMGFFVVVHKSDYFRKVKKNRYILKKCYVAGCVLFFVVGCYITDAKHMFLQENIPKQGQQIVLRGTIKNYENKENSTAVYLKDCIYDNNIESLSKVCENSKSLNCVVYIKELPSIKIGNKITITGEVKTWQTPSNKGQFDEQAYNYGQDVHFCIFAKRVLNVSGENNGILMYALKIKMAIHNKFNEITNKRTAGIFQAMVLGEKNYVENEVKELFMEGSIGHILVVSGLHFSIAGMGIFRLVRKVLGVLPSAVAGLLVLLLFGLISGFSTSAIRAFVMCIVYIGSVITGRDYDLPTSLACAVFVILLKNPYTMFSSGFVLSVSAILGIAITVPVLTNSIKSKSKFINGMLSSLGIQIFTLPVSLYYYFYINPYSFILNALVIPFMPFVLVSGIFAVVISVVSLFAAKTVIYPAKLFLDAAGLLCKVMEKLIGYNVYPGRPQIVMCVIYYVIIVMLLIVYYKKERTPQKRWIVVFAMASLIFFFHKKSDLNITMLDVGQGQSIYIEAKNGGRFLYDGGSTDIGDVGKYRILPYLQAEGCVCLDGVFVSHLDEDHISGIIELIAEDDIRIKRIFLPDTSLVDSAYSELVAMAENKNISVSVFGEGSKIKLGNVIFTGLHPNSDFTTSNRNDTSIVIKLEYSGENNNTFSMLLCGDMEKEAQSRLLENNLLSDVDVLQVAHHGSGYTTSRQFLQITRPQFALISCGEGNRYGHPHADLIERLQRISNNIFVTKDSGAISIEIYKEKIKVETYKN